MLDVFLDNPPIFWSACVLGVLVYCVVGIATVCGLKRFDMPWFGFLVFEGDMFNHFDMPSETWVVGLAVLMWPACWAGYTLTLSLWLFWQTVYWPCWAMGRVLSRVCP